MTTETETGCAAPLKIRLFGPEVAKLEPEVAKYKNLIVTTKDPDVILCFGGDGTLLGAEILWPGIPKVPVLNSRRGHRCIPHPADQVIAHLAAGKLVSNEYTKLECAIHQGDGPSPAYVLTPLNEINVHKGRINSAVRYQIWLDDTPYDDGAEILGDGFVACTPFGSTAYFNKITRGMFSNGIGIAFEATSASTNHIIVSESTRVRFHISRGPAILAYDCAKEYVDLAEGDELIIRKNTQGATILTCAPVKRLDEPF